MRRSLAALRGSIEGSPGIAALIVASIVLPFLRGVPVASLLTLPLVFVLPGIALHAALLPHVRLLEWETVPIALGVSAAIVIATGLALNFTPGGLNPAAWTLLLTAVTVAAALLAMVRRARRPADENADAAPSSEGRPTLRETLQLGAGIAITTGLLVAARSLGGIPQTTFTQLWMLPGTASSSVDVGISNHEAAAESYTLILSVDEEQVDSFDVELERGATWERTLTIEIPDNSVVRAELFRLPDRATPYRTATLSTAPPVIPTPVPSPS